MYYQCVQSNQLHFIGPILRLAKLVLTKIGILPTQQYDEDIEEFIEQEQYQLII